MNKAGRWALISAYLEYHKRDFESPDVQDLRAKITTEFKPKVRSHAHNDHASKKGKQHTTRRKTRAIADAKQP